MANIDRIVQVSISLQTAGITSATFSDLLLFGVFTKPAGDTAVVYIITDPDELVDTYGVVDTDPMYKAAQVFFSQIPHPPRLFIGLDTNTTDPTNDLIAIANENNDWYGICNVDHDSSRLLKISDWVEAHEKLLVTTLNDSTDISAPPTDTTSTAHLLMAGNYYRTAWWWNPSLTEFPDVAIASKMFTKYPGQETWANQRLAGVISTFLNETTFSNIYAKNGNTFEPFRNINITQN